MLPRIDTIARGQFTAVDKLIVDGDRCQMGRSRELLVEGLNGIVHTERGVEGERGEERGIDLRVVGFVGMGELRRGNHL